MAHEFQISKVAFLSQILPTLAIPIKLVFYFIIPLYSLKTLSQLSVILNTKILWPGVDSWDKLVLSGNREAKEREKWERGQEEESKGKIKNKGEKEKKGRNRKNRDLEKPKIP